MAMTIISGLKCPICGGDVVDSPKSYSCGNWRNGCKFTIWKESFGHKVTVEEAQAMLDGEEIGPFDLVSKAGKEFSACMYYDFDENKVKLRFPERD